MTVSTEPRRDNDAKLIAYLAAVLKAVSQIHDGVSQGAFLYLPLRKIEPPWEKRS
jgi:hypothetical protein